MQGIDAALAAADRLARAVPGLVEAPVLAVILHGSLATGDFLPGRSDLDLLVVVDVQDPGDRLATDAAPLDALVRDAGHGDREVRGGRLAAAEAAALEALVRDADTGGASGIDLHVVAADVAGAPGPATALELHVGRYPSGVEVTVAAPADADLVAELSVARATGRSLLGAAPAEVLGPVPAAWVRDRGRYWLDRWRGLTDDDESAAHMVLTACRIWRFGVEGVHCGKLPAAAWAADRAPRLAAIPQAVRRYRDDPATPIAPPAIAAVLDAAAREA
ncbi:nucleotidyltransferase domain-containing protein [Dactylosporangium sp. AC04546]|uniref:nucleotidyltransferase domain-containing protein n=1 Tax=Dactylosporangium sp. AC04546 TaxID=2862460 RepID=UPI002E7C0395|nr:nucleotidyltransferase domain-containing protein [Dactylosporangium sp. AC04546]WVK78358.1 nucleotidyltransferase domain-containing protein [Dactylosporangium sp. AC04546]